MCNTNHTALPVPAGYQVRVKVMAADLSGNCFSGMVDAVGENVVSVIPGQRVVCDGKVPCGRCYSCRRGEPHHCSDVSCVSGMTEYAVIGETQVYPLPEGRSFDEGALTRMYADAFAALAKINRKLAYRLLVCGKGEMGVIVASMARHAGAGDLCYLAADEMSLQIVKKLGIPVLAAGESVESAVAAARSYYPESINVVVDTTGDNRLTRGLMDLICPAGLLLMVGETTSPDSGGLEFEDARDFFFRICSVAGSHPAAGWFRQGLDALMLDGAAAAELITGIRPLAERTRAEKTAGAGLGAAVVIHPND